MPNGAPRALEAGRVTVAVSAVDWLLESDEPGIVAQAELLARDRDDRGVELHADDREFHVAAEQTEDLPLP